jgi:type II restriction/modification system DNA methylase subunit YeeA
MAREERGTVWVAKKVGRTKVYSSHILHGHLPLTEKLAGDLRAKLGSPLPVDAQAVQNEDTKPHRRTHHISYAIGCMMGRYSLDKPSLIYAHSGNKDFDPSQYQTFPADDDGIIPMMETDWFPDDASSRLIEFSSVTWPKEHLEENLTFIAASLGPNRNEQPRDTIRRYLATGFYKQHLQMYKRRPIYWLFSSGKQRAFQCLVYLHRYHEGTLSRMRTEYVIPLQGKIVSRMDQLADDIAAATSTVHRRKLEKERDTLRKQHTELQAFDEQLRHYADQRISLDLDDGVKVNYGKFGDLLAEVKASTGGSLEEA